MLVICCIEAKFCKKICVGKLSPRSTQCTPLHRAQSSNVCLKIAEDFAKMLPNLLNQDQDQDLSGIEKRVFENNLEREDVARFPFLTPQPSAH